MGLRNHCQARAGSVGLKRDLLLGKVSIKDTRPPLLQRGNGAASFERQKDSLVQIKIRLRKSFEDRLIVAKNRLLPRGY